MAKKDPRTLRRRVAFAFAVEALGSTEAAQRWMSARIFGLNDQRPRDLLKTKEGTRRVLEVLNAIKYGVYL